MAMLFKKMCDSYYLMFQLRTQLMATWRVKVFLPRWVVAGKLLTSSSNSMLIPLFCLSQVFLDRLQN